MTGHPRAGVAFFGSLTNGNYLTGRRIVTVVPAPGSDKTSSVPPCAWTAAAA
jgi:hypothetical protein